MNQKIVTLLIAVLMSLGCSKDPDPIGLADWSAVMRVTEDLLNRGDSRSLIRHSDMSGVPRDRRKNVEIAIQGFKGAPQGFKLDEVEILDPRDYNPNEGESEKMAKMFPPSKWSRPPEKLIIYRYSGEKESSFQYVFGVFQAQQKWYFSTAYDD